MHHVCKCSCRYSCKCSWKHSCKCSCQYSSILHCTSPGVLQHLVQLHHVWVVCQEMHDGYLLDNVWV
jgi:hypothetical protein